MGEGAIAYHLASLFVVVYVGYRDGFRFVAFVGAVVRRDAAGVTGSRGGSVHD